LWLNNNRIIENLDVAKKNSKEMQQRIELPYIIDVEGEGDGRETEFMFYALNLALGTLDQETVDFVDTGSYAVRYVAKAAGEKPGTPVKALGWKRKEYVSHYI